MGGGREKKPGRENGVIASGYLAGHQQKLAYLHLSRHLLLSDLPFVPVVTGGGLWIEEKSPNNLKAKHIKEVDEVSVCIYSRLYLYSQNTYIRGYFQGSWVGTVQ